MPPDRACPAHRPDGPGPWEERRIGPAQGRPQPLHGRWSVPTLGSLPRRSRRPSNRHGPSAAQPANRRQAPRPSPSRTGRHARGDGRSASARREATAPVGPSLVRGSSLKRRRSAVERPQPGPNQHEHHRRDDDAEPGVASLPAVARRAHAGADRVIVAPVRCRGRAVFGGSVRRGHDAVALAPAWPGRAPTRRGPTNMAASMSGQARPSQIR